MILVLEVLDDQSTFFQQAMEYIFQEFVEPRPILPADLQKLSHVIGATLPPAQIKIIFKALLRQDTKNISQYYFIPKDRKELRQIKEWRELSTKLQAAVISVLWEPTHLGEFSFTSFPYHRLDLLEEMYGLTHEAILQGKIRFKLLKNRIQPQPEASEQKQIKINQTFLSAISAIDEQYLHIRHRELRLWFQQKVVNENIHIDDPLAHISPGELEVIYSEKNSPQGGQIIRDICDRIVAKVIAANLVESPWQEIFQPATCPFWSYQNDEESAQKCLYEILQIIPRDNLLIIQMEQDPEAQLKELHFLYRKLILAKLPQSLRSSLAKEAISPGQLLVIWKAVEAEKKIIAARAKTVKPVQQKPVLEEVGQKIFNLLGLADKEPAAPAVEKKKLLLVEEMLHAIGEKIIPDVSANKLHFILQIRDRKLLDCLDDGFNSYLPKVKQNIIKPLLALYNTPAWSIVKALKHVNDIDLELLAALPKLLAAGLLDESFASLLAQVFKRKIKFLKTYHVEEVQKNRNVILFFKQRFLQLKKGVVALVEKNIQLLKKHHELLPYLFKWQSENLINLFNDPQQLSKFITNLASQQGGRRIIYEE